MKNKLGFDVIDENLYSQLFPSFPRAAINADGERRVRDQYANFGVDLPPTMPDYPRHDWSLPKLQGETLYEHFEAMAKQFAGPYDAKMRNLCRQGLPTPPLVSRIVKQAGWTRYAADGVTTVSHPLEDCFVFDCETFVTAGNFPIIAIAASTSAWYIWLDAALVNPELTYEPTLYSLGGGKLGIGHNVSFDSLRSVESHWLDTPANETRNYFFDTMSAHIVMAGYAGPQRWVANVPNPPAWAESGCENSLLACYNFYCQPETPLTPAAKEIRDIFVKATDIYLIFEWLDECLTYAIADVSYTFELFKVIYNRFRLKRPSWTSLAGFLHQSAHNLPVVDDWFAWIGRVEAKLEEFEAEIDHIGRQMSSELIDRFAKFWQATGLDQAAITSTHNEMLESLKKGEQPEQLSRLMVDEWLAMMLCPWTGREQLDWAIKPRARKHKGMPEWYRNLLDTDKIGRANRYLHLLLKLRYRPEDIGDSDPGFPVFWAGQAAKWCYRRDGRVLPVLKPGTEDERGQVLLAKDFQQLFANNVLVSDNGEMGNLALDRAMTITYWVSCRERTMSQIVHRSEYRTRDGITGQCNVIAPDLVPLGTVSGRGVSPLWLTVTDLSPKKRKKIGVELKSRIQAPPGKVILNADMSAQELRVGSIYADSVAPRQNHTDRRQLGYIGASLMSYGVLAGNKEAGTDSHSQLAKAVGIDRDTAKVLAYALLYGAGVKTVAETIQSYYRSKFQPASWEYCQQKAREVIQLRKGTTLEKWGHIYHGGTDSACFTLLGELASKPYPKTTVLGNTLTAPLCPANVGREYATGRTNWGIQSAARDQGDCVMVAFHWLCQQHGINARIIFLIHDEYVALCDECDQEIAVWLLNVAHLWTWALTNERLDIHDMSTEGLWFDDVISQKCLRKQADYSTQTPSNPDEVIPPGKLYTKWQLPELNEKAISLAPHLYHK